MNCLIYFAGNGGSTLTTVSFLHDKYGDDLFNQKVLLIHAGGQSQRMPSASVLGKVFAPVPMGNPIYQMFDIKLAMYCPLIPKMGPGIFITCADDFLVYNLGDDWELNNDLQFSQTGFTALAHPSTVKVGTVHGVFVIKDVEKVDPSVPVQICECLEVLQKPSEVVMYEKGAVLKSENLHFSDGIKIFGRAAYTDSSFFFSHNVTRKLAAFVDKNGGINCEIDAYGDFLQALGPRATSQYIHNTSNVSTVTPNLIETRKDIFDLLKGSELSLLVMNSSKFIHVGTTKEYIHHFCCDHTFQEEMGLSLDVFNAWTGKGNYTPENGIGDVKSIGEPVQKKAKTESQSDICDGCVMHSVLPSSSTVSRLSVVEYSHFSIPVSVGPNTIISNCEYNSSARGEEISKRIFEMEHDDSSGIIMPHSKNSSTHSTILKIPNDTFLHTVPIKVDGKTKYVTVFFDVNDSLKKVAASDCVRKLHFLGKTVGDFSDCFDVDLKSMKEENSKPGSKVNLWFTDLFPVTDSMSSSLALTLQLIDAFRRMAVKDISLRSYQLVSMATILKKKDVFAMLSHRNMLFKKIKGE